MDVLTLPVLVGLVAGSLSTYSLVPQLLKCWRLGDAEAVSYRMFAVRSVGAVLWAVYGFFVGSLPILVFSTTGLALSGAIMVLKKRAERLGATC
jgi:MtN3 and saliva related transmembrane protein